MPKNNEKNKEKKVQESSEFSLYDKSGKQKSFGLSIVAMIIGVLSLILSVFGWWSVAFAAAGIAIGIIAIIISIVAKVKIGYFNSFIIIGIVLGIFASVLSIFFCIYTAYFPEILKWIEGTKNTGVENV